jgi:hypothetical protein
MHYLWYVQRMQKQFVRFCQHENFLRYLQFKTKKKKTVSTTKLIRITIVPMNITDPPRPPNASGMVQSTAICILNNQKQRKKVRKQTKEFRLKLTQIVFFQHLVKNLFF